jgi:hypothetical protein
MVHQEVTLTFWRVTKAFLYMPMSVIVLVVIGCSATTHVKQLSQTVVASLRKPGEQLVHSPEKTQEKYGCILQNKKIFQLEEVQVLPDVISAGKEINQRIRYALCSFTRPEIVRGSITRTVTFRGNSVMRDFTNYEFRSGTWIVDAFIGVPEGAESGTYMIDTVLKYENKLIKATNSFVVKGK